MNLRGPDIARKAFSRGPQLFFTLTKTGLMYEASVGGQKFSYQGLDPRGS